MGEFVDLFALSVFRESLGVESDFRNQIVGKILQMEAESNPRRLDSQLASTAETLDDESAWLGDTAGFEFLFQQDSFQPLFEKIGEAIKSYTASLGLNNEALTFYYQRSWATVSREGERIFEHAHVQSHLSFAYYVRKPKDGGGIYFSVHEHPNELAPGLFTLTKSETGIIKSPNERTLNRTYLEPQEDEILIFPSKTLHSTAPNMTTDPRISISADVVITLKDSQGHETLMPRIENWQSF